MLAKGGRAQGVGRDQVRACYLRVRLCVPSPAFRGASLIFECVLLTEAGASLIKHQTNEEQPKDTRKWTQPSGQRDT